MKRCDVEGLHLLRCSQYTVSGEDLCYYHQKLLGGLLFPPSDDELFWPEEEGEWQGLPDYIAWLSYEESNHPEFAKLVPTGGVTLVDVSAA